MKKQANKTNFNAIKKNQLKTIVGGIASTSSTTVTSASAGKAVTNKGVAGY